MDVNLVEVHTPNQASGDFDYNQLADLRQKPFEHMQKTASEFKEVDYKKPAESAQIRPLQCQPPQVLTKELSTDQQFATTQPDMEYQTNATGEEASAAKGSSTNFNDAHENFTHDDISALRQHTEKTVGKLSTEMHIGFKKQAEMFQSFTEVLKEHTKESESKIPANYEKELKNVNDKISTIKSQVDQLVDYNESTQEERKSQMRLLEKMHKMMERQFGEHEILRQEVHQLAKKVETVLNVDEN